MGVLLLLLLLLLLLFHWIELDSFCVRLNWTELHRTIIDIISLLSSYYLILSYIVLYRIILSYIVLYRTVFQPKIENRKKKKLKVYTIYI